MSEREYEAIFMVLIKITAKDKADARQMALAELAHLCEQGTVHPQLYEVQND